ncbi:MAG: nodulation protein NfeD [Chloroflexi bacterium]|nr:nodulation protein NfeD [Chloroflexota bacterium]
MRRWRWLVWMALLLLGLVAAVGAVEAQGGNRVVVAPIREVINPPLAEFVVRVIDRAESSGATAVVFEMDTPGGLDASMRQINQRILNSRVPVVVYVAPPGARAGSAGVYITYAAHVAAMAPNTNIGSATPVALGEGGEQQMSDEMRAKVQNDAAAYLRGLASQRGRNAEWAEKAVRQGANVTAREAVDLKVIDLVAPDLQTLLREIDGRRVQTAAGEVQLATAEAQVERVDMNPVEALLHLISNPTIAYILLSLGSLGLFLELSSPGAILPGVVGGICMLLAFYALGTLPVNYAGLALLLFGLLLFVADLFAPSHGILTTGGAIAFILGSFLLFNVPEAAPFLRISLAVILAVSLTLVGFLVFVLGAIIRSRRRKVVTGREGLIGRAGYARTPLDPSGMVWVDGELWGATSEDGEVTPGQAIEVVRIQGLHLFVRPTPVRAPLGEEWLEASGDGSGAKSQVGPVQRKSERRSVSSG